MSDARDMTVYPARYTSRCTACGERIVPGDMCKWDEGDFIHEDCMEEPGSITPVVDICARCFMQRALNGRCGCDE